MAVRADTLDQRDRLSRPLLGSVAFHVSLAGTLILYGTVLHRAPEMWGSPTGGRMGSVAVNPVGRIPLPGRAAPENPVANDTESQVPSPPPNAAKAKPKAKVPEPDAIAIRGRAARDRGGEYSSLNKFREKQHDQSNQLYTPGGAAVSSRMYGMAGSGQLGVGDNSPFGTQFGWYAKLLIDKVGQAWRSSDLDPRIQNVAAVTFTIRRDGTLSGSVLVSQSSGNRALDLSAQRAILDAAPFPPLPQQFPRSDAVVELRFSVK